jgi:ribosomal RNA assembly protein
MISIIVENPKRIKKAIPILKNKVKAKLRLEKDELIIDSSLGEEYILQQIIKAVDFGFNAEDALLLLNTDYALEFVNIKENTRRKNLQDVRARVIGTEGKAKRAIETLTGAAVAINANQVGIIVNCEHLNTTINAVRSLIQGAKHANVFAYLEKQNANLKKRDDDLGLKDFKWKKK